MKKSNLFPISLILIGAFLLLIQFDLFEFSRPYIIIFGSAIFAALLIRKATISSDRKGMIGGSFFSMLTVILLALDLGYIPFYDHHCRIRYKYFRSRHRHLRNCGYDGESMQGEVRPRGIPCRVE